jgi:argininosuccinate synthase
MKKKIVLAYSGGLDTSVIVHWLAYAKGYEVVCFVANVGQQEDFEKVKTKAINSGASKVYVSDLRNEFVTDFIFPALKAHAIYEGSYLLGTALARPLIAKYQVACAHQEGTQLLAHGATGKGNDQVRFELAYASLLPSVHVISPWKDADFLAQFHGRADLIEYANKHGIPISSTHAKPYSIDENLMHTSYESGILEDPVHTPDNGMFLKTHSIEHTPDKSVDITITFKQGIPITIVNHLTSEAVKGAVELLTYLNLLGGLHGIGRVDMVENRFVGIKSRGIYETPAGTILFKAHRDLESITLDKEVSHIKDELALKIAKLIYNGFWYSPEMAVLMTAVDKSQENVSGHVHMTLYKGNVIITGREAPKSLYNSAIASMQEFGGYNQLDAKGFIALHALRLKIAKTKDLI